MEPATNGPAFDFQNAPWHRPSPARCREAGEHLSAGWAVCRQRGHLGSQSLRPGEHCHRAKQLEGGWAQGRRLGWAGSVTLYILWPGRELQVALEVSQGRLFPRGPVEAAEPSRSGETPRLGRRPSRRSPCHLTKSIRLPCVCTELAPIPKLSRAKKGWPRWGL